MRSERARLVVTLAGLLALFGGCALTPPSSGQRSASGAKGSADEYEGWLFNSLRGRRQSDAPSVAPDALPSTGQQSPPSPEAQPPGVIQTSANFPATPTPGPMIPGPSTEPLGPRELELMTAPPETVAGPPPAIPGELPGPPAESISINDIKVKPDEKKKSFELADLAPENIYKNVKNATGFGPDEKIARAAMKEGEALFLQKNYLEAAKKFATAASRWPDSPLEERALFMQGESEFFADQYPKAHDTYGGLLKKHTNTRHLDTVSAREFAMGRYWEQLYTAKPTWPTTPNVTDKSRPLFDTKGYAIQAYERVRIHDPTGPLADDSVMALANLYFRSGQFEDAAYQYDVLCREYPNSEHQRNAHLLGLQSKMRVYQGTLYDEKPLKDAQRFADQTLKQFGNKLGDEQERVLLARAQILEERANRDFSRGRYYEGRKAFGAARIYYKSVVEEFPTTQKAKEAQARLEAIRNEPDEPPSQLKWLTGIFEPKT